MSTLVDRRPSPWSKWLDKTGPSPPSSSSMAKALPPPPKPSQSTPSSDETPASDVPDLLYASPGDPSSPSSSSSSHDHQLQMQNPPDVFKPLPASPKHTSAPVDEINVHVPPLPHTPNYLTDRSSSYLSSPAVSVSGHSYANAPLGTTARQSSTKRSPNKLRKNPPSVYRTRHAMTLSFIPDQPLPEDSNFPYSFQPAPSARSSFFGQPPPPGSAVSSTLHWIPQENRNDFGLLHRTTSTPSEALSVARTLSPSERSSGRPVSSIASYVPLLQGKSSISIRREKTMPASASAPPRKLVKSRRSQHVDDLQYASLRSQLSPVSPDADMSSQAIVRDAQLDGPVISPAEGYSQTLHDVPEFARPADAPSSGFEAQPRPPPPPPKKKLGLSFSLKRWKSTGPNGHVSRPLPPVPPPVPSKSLIGRPRPLVEIVHSRAFRSDDGHYTDSDAMGGSNGGMQPLPSVWTGAEKIVMLKSPPPKRASLRPRPSSVEQEAPSRPALELSQSPLPALPVAGPSALTSSPVDYTDEATERERIIKTRKKLFTLDDSSDTETDTREGHGQLQGAVVDLTPTADEFGVPFPARPRPRPQLVRRFAETPTKSDEHMAERRVRVVSRGQRRRWTLAMTDDGVTDEKLVEEFQRLRSDSGHDENAGDSEDEQLEMRRNSLPEAPPALSDDFMHDGQSYVPRLSTSLSSPTLETMGEESRWPSALRALLTTRDLLRTERNYLRSLQVLLQSCPCELPSDYRVVLADIPSNSRSAAEQPAPESQQLPWPAKPPATVMVVYLMALIRTSSVMLKKMQDNPSVFGVTMAFVLCEDVLEEAYVAWCGSVASWYQNPVVDNDSSSLSRAGRRLSRAKFSSSHLSATSSTVSAAPPLPGSTVASPDPSEKSAMSPEPKELPTVLVQTSPQPTSDARSRKASLKRSASSAWRRSMPALPMLITGASTESESGHGHGNGHGSISPHSPTFFTSKKKTQKYKAKMMSVRELGILPVQRITRYGLLFKDLLKHCPPSSSTRALVERAADISDRIATRCNRVQDHPAF